MHSDIFIDLGIGSCEELSLHFETLFSQGLYFSQDLHIGLGINAFCHEKVRLTSTENFRLLKL